MSDIHRLPLIGHDMPEYYLASFDEPEIRARVFARRAVTGHQYWYFRVVSNDILDPQLHGPYLSAADAGDDAEKVVHAYR